MILELGVCVAIFCVALYVWLTWNFNHWKNVGIPYLEPTLFFGNVKDYLLVKKAKGLVYNDLYRQSSEPAVGIFAMRQPQLLIRDMGFCKIIFNNEFSSFMDNNLYIEPSDFVHASHAFFLTGDKWKKTRSTVTNAFTISKLKLYVPQMVDCCKEMFKYIEDNPDKEFQGKYFASLCTNDIVMSVIYGIHSNSFKDSNSTYRSQFNNLISPGMWPVMKYTFANAFPSLGHFFKIGITPKSFVDFYTDVVREAVAYRKTNNVKRNDFLQHLIDCAGKDGNPDFTPKEMLQITMNLITDGIQSTALALSYIIELLMRFPEEQKKLVKEIDSKIQTVEDITYDRLNSLSYLNAFILEATRYRTMFPLLERRCTKDCKISYEGKDYNFTKGDSVAISLYSIHNDSKYFPEPEKFKAERFMDSKDPQGYVAFGTGPRACLGKQFGLLQIKAFLCTLLKHYEVVPSRELPEKVEYDVNSLFSLIVKGGVWFKVKKRQN